MSISDEIMEERFVAFIDILGFKDIVRNIEKDNTPNNLALRTVKSVLNFMDEETYEPNYCSDLPIYEKTEEGFVEKELGDPRLTYVSDCIIISAEPTIDGFKGLSRKIHKITADLACDGIFCRGAITKGKLFHKGRILFGSSYIRAFTLEEETAIFPRVIIDPEIIDFFELKEGEMPLAPAFFGLDKDGIYYQRYWTWYLFPPHAGSFESYLHRVYTHIENKLNEFRDTPRILEKYKWLEQEFKSLVSWWQDLELIELEEHDSRRV